MGCASSKSDGDPADRSRPATPEARALDRYRRMREARSPGYLTRNPESLNDYKLLLNREGALGSSDDDDDPFGNPNTASRASRKSRDITVISNRSGSTTSAPRSALRSRRTSECGSAAVSPSASFIDMTGLGDSKRVMFGGTTDITQPPSVPSTKSLQPPLSHFATPQPSPRPPPSSDHHQPVSTVVSAAGAAATIDIGADDDVTLQHPNAVPSSSTVCDPSSA